LITTMGEFGSSFLLALFLQRVLPLTPFPAGQMLIPGALIWGFSNLIARRLADQINNRLLVGVALVMIAVAFYRFSHIDLWSTTTYILSLFMVQSFARGLSQSPLINFPMAVLPKEEVIMGPGLRGLRTGLASTFGLSMAAIFVEKQQTVHAPAFSEDQRLYPIGAAEAVAAARGALYGVGEWDPLPTKAMLLVRKVMLDEAALMA
jgi:sugar phosphate permease